MPAADLQELLRPFRLPVGTPTDPTSIAIAVGDEDACRMLAAFSRLPLPDWRPRRRAPEETNARWLWLWSGYLGGPDEPMFLTELAVRAGIPYHRARVKWPALAASRLVFPDGTMSEGAQLLLRSFVFERMPKPPAARGGRS